MTTKFDMTKQDMRNGRKTGLPVSACIRISRMVSHVEHTRVEGRIDDLFGMPELSVHLCELALLVSCD